MDDNEMPRDEQDDDLVYLDDVSYEVEDNDGEADENEAEEMEDGEEASAWIEPAREDAKVVLKSHTDAVLAVRLDALTGKLAVTGGQDDVGRCWEALSGKQLFDITEHTDSVTSVAFNVDSSLVATADMNGTVQVWSTATQRRIIQVSLSEVEWLAFHNHEARALLCGHSDGTVTMWQVPKQSAEAGESASLLRNKTLFGSGSACSKGVLFADGKRLASAHEDGSVRIWNLAGSNQLRCWERRDVGGKDDAVLTPTSLDVHRDDVLCAVGRVDGRVQLLHSQNGRLLVTFDCCKSEPASSSTQDDEPASQSCESLVFVNALDVLAVGALDGTVTLFDLGSSRVRASWRLPDGARMSKLLSFGDAPNMVATAGLDAVVRLYDVRNQQVVRELHGHCAQILDADYSSSSRLLITASDDHTARIFEPFAN